MNGKTNRKMTKSDEKANQLPPPLHSTSSSELRNRGTRGYLQQVQHKGREQLLSLQRLNGHLKCIQNHLRHYMQQRLPSAIPYFSYFPARLCQPLTSYSQQVLIKQTTRYNHPYLRTITPLILREFLHKFLHK
eukprot:GILI01001873.1.p2 GENE.GILI01001873.1~~GILI01001873.1.p2  ORF type:complete len:133 (+),score=13.83 GILI01001873.1:266-664(+)